MKRLCLLAFLCFLCPSKASQIDKEDDPQVNIIPGAQPMPFKLGIELQEIHHLCKDAKLRKDIQKKPLFFVKDRETNNPLWELVIDGEDIEFVLKPSPPI